MVFLPLVMSIGFQASCTSRVQNDADAAGIIPGAERTEEYFSVLQGKTLALVTNHTSLVAGVHLVDTLRNSGFAVAKIFSPEHGFRGDAGAGEKISSGFDPVTGLPVISLYGSKRKPSASDLEGTDLLVFDLQDVGVRFYTYVSTLSYVMEACAELSIPVLLLDRPNPNGDFVDGPVLEKAFSSFVGLHPVPVVHGMTLGEYALMINGEEWLKDRVKAGLTIVKVGNYEHSGRYCLPVKPSPNLPNMASVYLYPSLCFFEGTIISVGRGTETPFQIIGHPDYMPGVYVFTPRSIPGGALTPKYQDTTCYGINLISFSEGIVQKERRIHLSWLFQMYSYFKASGDFFTSYFDYLAGTADLRNQIISGRTGDEIRASWQEGLEKFKKIRRKYLLYPDFE
ncbi:MAG: DUF1343 domain-containing protein [Bacteroidales bacterium]|nr:DUF1343 domain-containing protein [Bacteroidales bacterium]